jgi:hypothetical protein
MPNEVPPSICPYCRYMIRQGAEHCTCVKSVRARATEQPTPGAGGAGDVYIDAVAVRKALSPEDDAWLLNGMTQEDVRSVMRQNATLRAAVEKITSFPGTTLGPPIETGSDRDTPENRAFQRGLDMAFHRCAETARAALARGPAADGQG